jgi:glutathione S-transferase
VTQGPILYGATYSVYVQAVRLTLWTKGVPYELVEVDAWTEGKGAEHLKRHPFGRIPAFEHDGVRLYETAPICRYVDETFQGRPLQPASPPSRAVMGQAISIMDNYAYRSLVWGVYIGRIGASGRPPDPARVEAAHAMAATCIRALDALAPASSWLVGDCLTLADLHAAPMFHLFMQTPDATVMMEPHDRLRSWWTKMQSYAAPSQIM